MAKLNINIGDRFDKLVVLYEETAYRLPCGQINRMMRCVCDCGRETSVRVMHLVRGRTRSCGCLGGERHGDAGTELYVKWHAIKYRCHEIPYHNSYTKKHITVCDEWRHSYVLFKKWAINNGYMPGLTIDRIDNNLGYSPENCRFITNRENANNKSDTVWVFYHGEKRTLMSIIYDKKMLLHESTIRTRIKRGWRADRAIDTPIRQGNYFKKLYTENDSILKRQNNKKYNPEYYLGIKEKRIRRQRD